MSAKPMTMTRLDIPPSPFAAQEPSGRSSAAPRRRKVVVLRLALVALALSLAPTRAQAQEIIEYYATDALGSVRVAFDAGGTELGRTDYLPFGEEAFADADLPAQRFTGQERDGEANLDNFNARMLQRRVGRFGTPDPIFGHLFDPQALNRYSYVRNSPMVLIDPTGLELQCVVHEYMKTIPLTTGNDPSGGKRGEEYVLVYDLSCVNYGDSSPESPGIDVPTDPTGTPGGGGGGGTPGGGSGPGGTDGGGPSGGPEGNPGGGPKRPSPGPRKPPRTPFGGCSAGSTWWNRTTDNFKLTQKLPGLLAPSGLGFGLGAGQTVARALGIADAAGPVGVLSQTPGPAAWVVGAQFVASRAPAFVLVGGAYEAGVFVGSAARAAVLCN